jgi:tetratricopeptide (TPR) repeat protein
MKRVLALADRLRAGGVDAMIDQYVHDPEDGWQTWTETQMREADLVLVVCTETYLRRAERREEPDTGHGAIWEISVAYVLLYNRGMKNTKFIPVVFEKTDRVYIPLPLQSYTNYCTANDEAYLELYRRLTNQPLITMPELGKIESLPVRKVSTKSMPSTKREGEGVWNVPHSRNEAFTGREQILSDLHADLVKKGKQALSGLGGVGKTQAAVEYAYRHKDEYTAVLWTFADTEQSVRGGFGRIAALLNLPEKDATEQAKVTEAVQHWLEENPGWLLVFDNADDPGVLKAFLPQQEKGHLLLTSRAHQFQKLGIFSPREVDVLSPKEAREFLLLRTGKDVAKKSPYADELSKELGYLPLALEQAAVYIVEKSAGFASYLAGFKKQRQALLNQQGPVLGNEAKEQQKRTVATTWAVNFADIEKNFPASADLLRLSAFLAPDSIPLELFEKGATEMPPTLAAKLADVADNPLVLDELLTPLLRFSLIRRDEEKRAYSIHPLTQEVVREGLSKEDQRVWAERSVRTVNSSFPNPQFEHWPACDRLLLQALACAGLIESWGMEFAEAARLLNKSSSYLQERAEYVQAELLCLQTLEIYEKALGKEHPTTATGMNNLAFAYHNQGRNEEAELLYQRALEITEKTQGAEHSLTAIGLNNLATVYHDLGKYEEAEPLHLRALAITEKTQGAEHPWTAIRLNNLAELYRLQGRFGEAEPLYWRAIKIREKALGAEHPDTAYSLNCLAVLFDTQGNHREAEPLYRRALAIREKALGPEHPKTVLVLTNLIHFYRERGRNAEADALEKAAKGTAG